MPPPDSSFPPRPRPWPALIAGALVVGLLALYPPFRVGSRSTPNRPPDQSGTGTSASTGSTAAPDATPAGFSAAAFAERFWTAQLMPAAAQAPALAPVLVDLRRDPAAAARDHGRRVGLGGTAYLFARGTGRVVAVERSRLLLEFDGTTIALRTGPVFGNTVRDGCGLLDLNRSPGLTEFNAVAAELNRLVEQRVQPTLRAAVVGATVSFTGAAEMPEAPPTDGPVLLFIPVLTEVNP